MISRRLLTTWLWLGFLVFAVGCGGDGKYPVSGTVGWNGDPIPEGSIIFTPVDPSVGPDAGQIENGRFRFRASAGPKKVEIFADRDVGKPDPVMNVVRREQYIPIRYNEETELTVEVTPQGPNDFQLDLVAKEGDRKAGS